MGAPAPFNAAVFGGKFVSRIGLAVIASATLVGCEAGSASFDRAPVSGIVFTGGKPLAAGTIRFVPIDGTPGPIATAALAEGAYSFDRENGPAVGKHRVEVVAADFLGFDPGDQEAAERALKANKGKRPRNPVPPGYGERSPLRAEVPPEGLPSCDFVLDPRGGAVASL